MLVVVVVVVVVVWLCGCGGGGKGEGEREGVEKVDSCDSNSILNSHILRAVFLFLSLSAGQCCRSVPLWQSDWNGKTTKVSKQIAGPKNGQLNGQIIDVLRPVKRD